VGATAVGGAAARAAETRSPNRLIEDPYAQLLLEAAGDGAWSVHDRFDRESDPELSALERLRVGYAASRTKFFDDFFLSASDAGVRQAVILAAGLDSRAWRLPWPDGAVVYEIDQPKVLEFKQAALRSHDVQPRAGYVAVPVDLRTDWPNVLRDAGFDSARASAWSVEGLLPYLPAHAQDELFDRIHALAATGTRLAVEAFDAGFFDPVNLARQRALRQRYVDAAAERGQPVPDNSDLWYLHERNDVAEWLRTRGWNAGATSADELMTNYGRQPAADVRGSVPKTTFVEGRLTSPATPR
jgi:methyltransferase (TIGR00027 family)